MAERSTPSRLLDGFFEACVQYSKMDVTLFAIECLRGLPSEPNCANRKAKGVATPRLGCGRPSADPKQGSPKGKPSLADLSCPDSQRSLRDLRPRVNTASSTAAIEPSSLTESRLLTYNIGRGSPSSNWKCKIPRLVIGDRKTPTQSGSSGTQSSRSRERRMTREISVGG